MKYYAFLEEIEEVEGELSLIFDSIHAESVRNRKLNSNLQSIQTFQIVLSVGKNILKKRYNKKTLMLNRWYEITMTRQRSGIECIRYNFNNSQELALNVDSIKVLDRRNRLQKELMKSSSLDSLEDATVTEIENCLPSLDINSNFLMKVMNVGQGNAVKFYSSDSDELDLFYVDVGGGILRNRSSYNDSANFKPVENAPIILTHWDMDHWVSLIRKGDELKKTKVVVPRQSPLGLSHIKLATDLYSNDRLLIWPESQKVVHSELLDIHKLKKHRDRNYSGLVVVAKTDRNGSKDALITGDAPYVRCEFLNDYSIKTVVVPHHGGLFKKDSVPQAPEYAVSVYSFGNGNSYGHPNDLTKEKHRDKGWVTEFNTVGGDVIIYNKSALHLDDEFFLALSDIKLAKHF